MLGKQQTENISCKTNLYSILFYSMGWSHTIAIEPQGRVFAAQLYTCTLCHRVYSVPVLMDDPWAYSTLGYNRPYSLTLCQHFLSRNQTGSHLPRSLRESNSRFFLLSTISGCFYPQRFPCLCFQDPLSFPQPVSDLSFSYNLDPVQAVKRDFVNTLLIFWQTTGAYNNDFYFYLFTG